MEEVAGATSSKVQKMENTSESGRILKVGDEVCTIFNGKLIFGTILTSKAPNQALFSCTVKWNDENVPDGIDTINHASEIKRCDLILTDRPLLRGCKVKKVKDGGDLVGVCRNITTTCDLRILGSNTILPSVFIQNQNFIHLKDYKQKSIVHYKGWIGIITDVTRNACLRLKTGLKFKCPMKCLVKGRGGDSMEENPCTEEIYFGLLSQLNSYAIVKDEDKDGFKEQAKKGTYENIYIEDLELEKIIINWLFQVCIMSPKKPQTEFKGAELKKVKIVKEDNEGFFDVGNIGRVKINEFGDFVTISDWDKNYVRKYINDKFHLLSEKYAPSPRAYLPQSEMEEKLQTNNLGAVEIHHSNRIGDITWQDGSSEFVKSKDLLMLDESLLIDTYMPGDFVYSNTFGKSFKEVYAVVLNSDIQKKEVTVKVLACESLPEEIRIVNNKIPYKNVKPHPRYGFLNKQDTIAAVLDKIYMSGTRVGHVQRANPEGKVCIRFSDNNKDEWVWPADCAIYYVRGRGTDLEKIYDPLFDDEPSTSNSNDNVEMPMEVDQNQTNGESGSNCNIFEENFIVVEMDSRTSQHHFNSSAIENQHQPYFIKTIKKEWENIKENCPPGIKVQAFANRIDLFSVVIEGPSSTPYENSLYFFDVQLPSNYPNIPPHFHFHSFGAGRLNPNLYAEGKVCVSLLGTWSSPNHQEKWTKDSTLLQILISIQALILVNEPFHNEPGYEQTRYLPPSTAYPVCCEYNNNLMPLVAQMIINQMDRPLNYWAEDTITYYKENIPKFIERMENWLKCSQSHSKKEDFLAALGDKKPEFAIYPFKIPTRTRLTSQFISLRKKFNLN